MSKIAFPLVNLTLFICYIYSIFSARSKSKETLLVEKCEDGSFSIAVGNDV